MTRKPKMLQFLRKLQEVQAKYIDTVSIEIRAKKYLDDGTYAVNACFISKTRAVQADDIENDPLIVNMSIYSFYTNAENKSILDGFIKECSKENQLILAKSFKSCKN